MLTIENSYCLKQFGLIKVRYYKESVQYYKIFFNSGP